MGKSRAMFAALLLVLGSASLAGCGSQDELDGKRDEAGAITEAGEVRVNAVRVGDCFDDGPPAELQNDQELIVVSAVPCSDPHDNEVYHLGSLVDGEFPGEEEVRAQVYEACLGQFDVFVGTNYDDSQLDIAYIYPSDASWGEGDRGFVCAVYDLDEAKLTGTMRASGI